MIRFNNWTLKRMVLPATLLAAVFGSGCNLTGGLDGPKGNDEIYADAQSKMDAGDCGGAIQKLNSAGTMDDKMYRLRGWALLCQAGVPFSKIASSVLQYGSSTTDFTVIGTLANSMVPMTLANIDTITSAIASFGQMTSLANADDKAANLVLANVVKAAAIIATASSDGVSVKKADVSVSGCNGIPITGCSTGGAACTVTGTGRLGDGDALLVATTIQAAQTAASGSASLGSAGTLAGNLNGYLVGAAAATSRCTIVNGMLSR